MGSSGAPSVADHTHKDLSTQAEQLSQLVGDFGTTCERLLLTHRKNIIRESDYTTPIYINVSVIITKSYALYHTLKKWYNNSLTTWILTTTKIKEQAPDLR